MSYLYLIVDLIVVFALVALSATVLLENSRAQLNRFFTWFVGSVSIWILANYISNDISRASKVAIIANYFVFCFSYAAAYFMLRFSITLAGDKRAETVVRKLSAPLLLIACLTFTPFIVSDVHRQDNVYAVQFGSLTTLYFLTLAILLGSVLYVLGKHIPHSTGSQRARLKVLFRSVCIAIPLLMITQSVLPALTGWFGLTNIGIFSMLIVVFGLYYSAVKHRLFDLRIIIVRALGYITTLGLLSGMYGLVSYYISQIIVQTHSAVLHVVLNVVLIMVVIAAYPPLRRMFDKITNRIFYRDAYVTQDVFDELNKILVSSLDLETILMQSAKVLVESMKPEYCTFVINETTHSKRRIFGTAESPESQGYLRLLEGQKANSKRLLSVDDFQPRHKEVRNQLRTANISVVVPLVSASSKESQRLGYMLLGPKKSGNPYTNEDLRVLDTIAKEIIITTQNALHFEEIQQFNSTLQNRINEATRKLRHTNEKLKTLDETKDDFISMASHQLRTPLTSVKGYLSMVIEEDVGKLNKKQQEMLGQAYISSQRMVYLIADLLNVSRLKNGKFMMQFSEVNLANMVQEELQQLQETAALSSLKLSYEKPDIFPVLELDETKIRQVIMNFIDNAIYYTPAGGTIEVQVIDLPKTIELRVKDSGIGVPKAQQPHLFTKFYRADNARKARPDGTGLGLFMAKKVVVAHGGAIIFESKEGAGSTFGFVVPKSKQSHT